MKINNLCVPNEKYERPAANNVSNPDTVNGRYGALSSRSLAEKPV